MVSTTYRRRAAAEEYVLSRSHAAHGPLHRRFDDLHEDLFMRGQRSSIPWSHYEFYHRQSQPSPYNILTVKQRGNGVEPRGFPRRHSQ
jgi:hypothetical protein